MANPIDELLKKRGYTGPNKQTFLQPQMTQLPRPSSMRGMDDAVALIIQAIQNQQTILIWGDYDVDGTTGTSLLVNFFEQIDVDVKWHIPNRIKDGYGLSLPFFSNFCKQHPTPLLITVDCGISNVNEINELQKRGVKVIVTDHHQLPPKLPNCPILNPSHPQCGMHETSLAGVGVAFYLAAGIRAKLQGMEPSRNLPKLKPFLAFVALGTLADLVELTPTNRILVRAGMESFLDTEFLGIQELLFSSSIYDGQLSSSEVGFSLAPKINAAGRYGKAEMIVELFCTKSENEAKKIAADLTKLNDKRKKRCQEEGREIEDSLLTSQVREDCCVLVSGDYFEGILGILASRMVEHYGLPAIVFTSDGKGCLKGSARSIPGLNMVEILQKNRHLLQKFGGHEMAAGMSLLENNWGAFYDATVTEMQLQLQNRPRKQNHRFDLPATIDEIFSPAQLKSYTQLEPFGPGNPQPLFYDEAAVVVAARTVGNTRAHLQLTLRGTYGENIKAIGFNLGEKGGMISRGDRVAIIYTPTINRYKEQKNWQAQIIDITLSS